MAIHASITGAPLRAPLPYPLTLLNRAEIEQEVERLIAFLDLLDGDADLEPAGDELDGDRAEDEFMVHLPDGPGCLCSDPAEADHRARRRAG